MLLHIPGAYVFLPWPNTWLLISYQSHYKTLFSPLLHQAVEPPTNRYSYRNNITAVSYRVLLSVKVSNRWPGRLSNCV
jgi:hypothetical protein